MEKKSGLKRIRMSKLPFMIGFGGTPQSRDVKLVFVDKTTDTHYTMRLLNEPDRGKFIVDFHKTEQASGQHTPLIRMIFDTSAIAKDEEIITKKVLETFPKNVVPINDNYFFNEKTVIPVSREPQALYYEQQGKEATVNEEKFAKVISSIKSTDDLTRMRVNAAIVAEGKELRGAIFLKEDKWYYFDIMNLAKELLFLLKPYMIIEGITEEQFIEGLKRPEPKNSERS